MVDYVIPANDDAAKSISVITGALCDAIAEGLQERKLEKEKEKEEKDAAAGNEDKESEAPVGKRLRSRKNSVKEEKPAEEATAEEAK